MKKRYVLIGLLGAVAGAAHADNSLLGDWPTSIKTDSGYEFGVKGLYQYDTNQFSSSAIDAQSGLPLFEDASTWRRKELDAYMKAPWGLEIKSGYDWQNSWTDNYVKYSSDKLGSLQMGQFKTLVGWDQNESASAISFLERSLVTSAVYEGRRLGLAWIWKQLDNWWLSAAYYSGGNLDGEHDGHGMGARVVYAPVHSDTEVMHWGLSASREYPDSETARFKSKPEAGLTDAALLDTGVLDHARAIDRMGFEAGWMQGPLLVQGEYLGLKADRGTGLGDFSSSGYYLQGAWMLTGESRIYKNSYFVNTKPDHAFGALELALRYSYLDLRDGEVDGGRQRDWTLGLNWYLGQHFKMQADYVWARANASQTLVLLNRNLDPSIFELRAQLYF